MRCHTTTDLRASKYFTEQVLQKEQRSHDFFIIIIICTVMAVVKNKKIKEIRRLPVQICRVKHVSCSEELSAQIGKHC